MPSFCAVPSIICVSNWPARPTNGSPCASSSAPGPSPTNTSLACSLPDAENDLVAALVQAAAAAIADVLADERRATRVAAEASAVLAGSGAPARRLARRAVQGVECRGPGRRRDTVAACSRFIGRRAGPAAASAPRRKCGRRSRAWRRAGARSSRPCAAPEPLRSSSDSKPVSRPDPPGCHHHVAVLRSAACGAPPGARFSVSAAKPISSRSPFFRPELGQDVRRGVEFQRDARGGLLDLLLRARWRRGSRPRRRP